LRLEEVAMLFDSWAGLGRVLLVGTLAYAALVLLLRVSGKRTLTKLNAFDLVVTVALGSTLATVLLSKSVALAEGVLALALLIGLQYAIAWLSVRSPASSRRQGRAHPAPAPRALSRTRDAGRAHHSRGDPRGLTGERRRRGRRDRGGGARDRRLDQRDPRRRGDGQRHDIGKFGPARPQPRNRPARA
jgi:hypothetical protein